MTNRVYAQQTPFLRSTDPQILYMIIRVIDIILNRVVNKMIIPHNDL